ncbi:hypothetical protein IWW48_000181 [Coemansia sp. RSA 1200]|nr:hypothetical protein IWW48_000181 [Coemansia sp. RSA 1200]
MGTSDENAGKSTIGGPVYAVVSDPELIQYLNDRDHRIMTMIEERMEIIDAAARRRMDGMVAELERKMDPLVQQITGLAQQVQAAAISQPHAEPAPGADQRSPPHGASVAQGRSTAPVRGDSMPDRMMAPLGDDPLSFLQRYAEIAVSYGGTLDDHGRRWFASHLRDPYFTPYMAAMDPRPPGSWAEVLERALGRIRMHQFGTLVGFNAEFARPMRNAEYPRTDTRLVTKYLAALDPAMLEMVYAWIDRGGFVPGQDPIIRLFTCTLSKEGSYRIRAQKLRDNLVGRRHSSNGTQPPQRDPRPGSRYASGNTTRKPARQPSGRPVAPVAAEQLRPGYGDSEEEEKDWFWRGE